MSGQELRVLRVLLVVARCLGCLPFTFTSSQATVSPLRDETRSVKTTKHDRLYSGFRRSSTWTIFSLVMVSLSIAGCCIISTIPNWDALFSVSNTLSTSQTLSIHCSLITGTILMFYLLLRSSSLIRLTNTFKEQYSSQLDFPESIWHPHKDWIFIAYVFIVSTSIIFCICSNLYYMLFENNHKLAISCDKSVTVIILLSWILKDMLKGFVVSLLYVMSQLLASLYWRLLASLLKEERELTDNKLKTQNMENMNYRGRDENVTEESLPRTTISRQTVREATTRLLALHDTQRLMNDFFSYSVILVLTQVLTTSTSIIFYITSGGDATPFRHASYFFMLESISTIICTCCSSDPVQRQVCASGGRCPG